MNESLLHMVVGLGNPGEKYASTRHNVGFRFLDFLAARHHLRFASSKWQAQTVRAELWEQPVLLAQPETYMNRSGQSVSAIAGFFRIVPDHIVVVHDDIDLEVGRIKIVRSRGAGGHNGIRSIINHLGSQDFVRVRIGVGRPVGPMPVESYVLSRFSTEESVKIEAVMALAEEGTRIAIADGPVAAMNAVNAER